MKISIIAAVAKNLAIGYKNSLCYKFKKDLKRFKEITTGHTIIMGENTLKSLGKPLPQRRNIVLSNNPDLIECESYKTLSEALDACKSDEEVFIIGGGMLYRTTIDIADNLYITEIDSVPENADTFFPEYMDKFKKVQEEWEEEAGIKFCFTKYVQMSVL